MSSFHKSIDSKLSINGTKIKNNLPFVSSGIPSLDHVVGELSSLFKVYNSSF